MKNKIYLLFLAIIISLSGCNSCSKKNQTADVPTQDSVILSFAFVGCNRIQAKDLADSTATNNRHDSSSANYYALQRIFSDINDLPSKPNLLFFLGDLVCGQTTLDTLDTQLRNWVKLYKSDSISKSSIELVAVPGNHEMLFFRRSGGKDITINKHDEWPLKGATEVWMKHMSPYMPADREKVAIPGDDVDQMTFSFVRNNTAFIVMNTDTYNQDSADVYHQGKTDFGIEGIIPEAWIEGKIKQYKKDSKIKHIFVLGHKPCYVDGVIDTGHEGLPEGPTLWPVLRQNEVCAMLSAHNHSYQRMQPDSNGTYQVIAGNGGSKGPTNFFGYTIINILKSGKVQLISKGFDVNPTKYYMSSSSPFTIRDTTTLTWGKNANPYTYTYTPKQ